MDVVHERAAGIDISKRDAKVAVRVPGARAGTYSTTVTTWGATVGPITELADHLRRQQVTVVVMEATGDYWKPFYFLLEEAGLPVMLVNAKQAKNIPGRKTDVSDAAWLAQLGAHGLLRGSFVPPEPIRQLRDLTRARKQAVQDRTRVIQRLEKFLESTGIKLSGVVSELTGVSARAMLDALVAGERDPERLASLARGSLSKKTVLLAEALRTSRFTDHHAFMIGEHLAAIDQMTGTIERIDTRIEAAIAPFRHLRDALTTIPGVSAKIAEVIIAETGGDMSVFSTGGHLASWAGVCPGSNESAGRVKSTHTRPGNPYLKGALGIAAMAATRNKNSYLAAKYRRIATRRGSLKALVAIEHTILIAAWNMLTTGQSFHDLGPDHYDHLNPERARNNAIRKLRDLGYDVIITPAAA
ncbi:MAG TPA: IS110 family transposase [Amnibacterium sp.]|jgi:transposase|uniref:IS110 family transposase n=1 Tax=Amnibacterium sp. TaxID=1872496 RepID=UPI002F9543E0